MITEKPPVSGMDEWQQLENEKIALMGQLSRGIELELAQARRRALEDAALRLEMFNTNSLYRKVLKKGAKLIREMKDGA